MITRYVNTLSTAGGDGTTNATSGASRAFATSRECLDSLGTSLSDSTVVWCEGSVADTSDLYQVPWDMTTNGFKLYFIGEQSPIHPNFSIAKAGKYDTTLYRNERTNTHCFYNNLPAHVEWHGLQAQCTANDASNYNCFRTTNANQVGAGIDFIVAHCIAKGVSTGGSTVYGFQPGVPGSGVGRSRIYNCVAIGCNQAFVNDNNSESYIWNCTVGGSGIGYVNNATCSVRNCLVTGATVGFVGTFHGSSSHNAEDDGNGAPGASSYTGTTFTFVNAAGGDYHLASGDTGARGRGIADPGNGLFINDIDGRVRGVTWDIGAHQFATVHPRITVDYRQFPKATIRQQYLRGVR